MAGTAQRSDLTHPTSRRGKHVHHGRTLAAWTGSVIALIAFVVGGIAVVIQNWWLLGAAVGLAAVALIVTVVLQRMGYGAS
jgi:membrane protein YdbS with pleckstrin-like domain